MNDSVNCNEIQAQLALFVGQDLDATEEARVAGHVNGCASCERERARLEHSRARLTSLREASALRGASVWSAVRQELLREGRIATSGSVAPNIHRGTRVLRWLTVSAAAAAVIAFAWFANQAGDGRLQAPVAPPVASTPTVSAPIELAINKLRKARPDEESLIQNARPLEPDLGRGLQSNNPEFGLVGDETIR
jgi:hypothetical protein